MNDCCRSTKGIGITKRKIGSPKRLEGRQDLSSLFVVAAVAAHQGDARLALKLLGERLHRGHVHDEGVGRQLVGRVLREVAIEAEDFPGIFDSVEGLADEDLRTDLVKAELERGDDAEVPATPSQRPEQIHILLRAGSNELPRGGDDVGGEEIVGCEPETPCQIADPTPEGQAADTRFRHDTGWSRQPERLCGRVDVAQAGAPLYCRGPALRIHGDVAHGREIDRQSVIQDGLAGDTVATAADGHSQPLLAGEVHSRDHVIVVLAVGDQRRLAVDHAVPDRAGSVVLVVIGAYHPALERTAESIVDRYFGHKFLLGPRTI